MKPMQIRALKLAADIDVSPSHISELVHGQRPITADTLEIEIRRGSNSAISPPSRENTVVYWPNIESKYSSAFADTSVVLLNGDRQDGKSSSRNDLSSSEVPIVTSHSGSATAKHRCCVSELCCGLAKRRGSQLICEPISHGSRHN